MDEQILVVDFGGQTAHLICRRLRDIGVFAQVISPQTPVFSWLRENQLDYRGVRGLVLSGSPHSVYEAESPQPHVQILGLMALVPTLGICYGLHWLAQNLGGTVEALPSKEYGPNPVQLLKGAASLKKVGSREQSADILQGIPERFISWMSHSDSLKNLPPHFELLAQSEQGLPSILQSSGLSARESPLGGAIAEGLRQSGEADLDLAAVKELQILGLQFHPEVSHCEAGEQFIANFARVICCYKGTWHLETWLEGKRMELRRAVGRVPTVLLISGGVDSSVVAALLLHSFPAEQLHLFYFDTGLMRKGETQEVLQQLQSLGAQNIHHIQAEQEFLAALSGITEPEQKRSIIGDLFIRIQAREIQKIFSEHTPYLLAQGTLYTDMIESGMGVGKYAAVIKSHHNVGTPLVQELRNEGRLLEPLCDLYKDEVRALGRQLGLGEDIVQRQPFPGPGLAIRILGDVTAQKLDLLRDVDALYLQLLKELGIFHEIWQAFAVLLPVQSVGVTGDSRRYGPVIALRAITSRDGMSAEVYPFRHEHLQSISTQISNHFPQISRVVYDVSAKPPATIEWE